MLEHRREKPLRAEHQIGISDQRRTASRERAGSPMCGGWCHRCMRDVKDMNDTIGNRGGYPHDEAARSAQTARPARASSPRRTPVAHRTRAPHNVYTQRRAARGAGRHRLGRWRAGRTAQPGCARSVRAHRTRGLRASDRMSAWSHAQDRLQGSSRGLQRDGACGRAQALSGARRRFVVVGLNR